MRQIIYVVRGRWTTRSRWIDLSFWSTAEKAEKALRRYRKVGLSAVLEVVGIRLDRDGFTRR